MQPKVAANISGDRQSFVQAAMNMLLSLAVGFAVITVATLFEACRAARWRDRKRFWRMVAMAIPLAGMSAVSLLAGTQYSATIFWGNAGFGPDWECEILGRAVPRCASGICRLRFRPIRRPRLLVDGSQAPP
ncbi:MAG: hypothetical protein QOK29_1948 [Rhodospirillaceae bacterium]|nr:hypothetical protein [Rhodospirillaceae bacterium]